MGRVRQRRGQRELGAVRAGPCSGMTAKTSTSRSVNTTRGRGTRGSAADPCPRGCWGHTDHGDGAGRGGGEGRAVEIHGKKGSAGHPLWQALPGFLAGCCTPQAGLPQQPCAPDCSRRPKTRGWRTEHLTSISTAGNKTSPAALGVRRAPISGSRAPEHEDKPGLLTPGAGSSSRSVAGSEGTLL